MLRERRTALTLGWGCSWVTNAQLRRSCRKDRSMTIAPSSEATGDSMICRSVSSLTLRSRFFGPGGWSKVSRAVASDERRKLTLIFVVGTSNLDRLPLGKILGDLDPVLVLFGEVGPQLSELRHFERRPGWTLPDCTVIQLFASETKMNMKYASR